MKEKKRSFERKLHYCLFFIIFCASALFHQSAYAVTPMSDYCIMPPYVKRDIKPNILIIMDNAKSMGVAAYPTSYDKTKTYNGYFRPGLMYSYSSNTWKPDSSGIYSGNLLNWVTTSRYDLLESILVGGISASRQTNINILVSVSTSWTQILTYTDSLGHARTCYFYVNSANVNISDDPNNPGSCGYLDTPAAYPIPGDPQVSSIQDGAAFPHYGFVPARREKDQTLFQRMTGKVLDLIAKAMDLTASDAEAANPCSGSSKVTITPGQPSAATLCTPFTYTASAAGGNTSPDPGYVWSVSSGSLPPGLSLSTTGTPANAVISGSPAYDAACSSYPCNYTFTLHVYDQCGDVNNHNDSKTYTLTVNSDLSITTTSPLPDATNTVWMRQTLSATAVCTGDTYTWSITSGQPSWMTIDASDGSIFTYATGTPILATVPTTYNFTVKVAGNANSHNYVTKNFSLTVQPEAGTFAISTTSPLPNAVRNVVYPQSIISTVNSICTPVGTTCNSNYTWSISSGSIPPGMTFSTGSFCVAGDHTYIYGTPTTAGTYTFTVHVTDTCGEAASKQFTLTVLPSLPAVRSTGNLSVRVCAGDYALNCGNAPSGTILKSGIVDQFWDQARFGVMDFSKQAGTAVTTIEKCSDTDPAQGSTPDPDFLTAIENAVPIDPITTLVNGEYTGINDYYAYATSPGQCDPIDDKPCRQNFVLMITDGEGANSPPDLTGGTPNILPTPPMPSGCSAGVNKNLTRNSCFGTSVDLRNNPTYGKDAAAGSQHVDTYIVNTMGTVRSSGYTPTMTPLNTGDILDQAAVKGGGKYYEVTDPTTLKAALMQAFQDIIKRAAAGTAASVLASGEGSGANLVQAVFYPRREFYNMSTGSYDEIAWVGRLTNFWYYVDPFFKSSYIREDDGDRILTLQTPAYSDPVRPGDYIVQMYFDTSSETTMAHRWTDTDGNAAPDTQFPRDIKFEGLGNLWEAGLELWKRNITTTPRTIYTTTNGSTLLPFTKANKTVLRPYLQATSDDEAEAIIRYVNGQDNPTTDGGTTYDYRPRTVTVNLCSTANVLCESDSDCPADSGGNPGTCSPQGTNTWKLGDVLNSTPRISSSIPLNAYDETYRDSSYAAYLATGLTTTADYQDRGMVFAGANDGMLHAFYLGKFSQLSSGTHVAQLTDPNGIGFGKEMWAYIPKNALPYLIYGTDPNYGTCHIYSVDLSPVVFDASIGTAGCSEANYWDCPKYNSDGTANTAAWRTILIGGMRFGGACKQTCGDTSCVQTPATDASGNPVGYSTYFAIDVTDQENPQLLWEFSGANVGERLGYTTAGPAVVRVNARPGADLAKDKTRDGRWFVVFGSGPTGGIDTANMQFLGSSDQYMKLYVFDLKQGPGAGITTFDTSTFIGANAFAGSLLDASHDSDLDYQDDVVYVPYVRQCTSAFSGNCTDTTKMTNGGVLRLRIKDASTVSSESNTALYPANWRLSSLIDDAGPMTSSVVRLQNTAGELWTFFGSGRYYYEQGSTVDDPSNRRRLFGVKDPCFTSAGWKPSCTSADTVGSSCGTTSLSSLLDVTDNPDATSADVTGGGHNGWCIWLDPEINPDPGATGCTGGQWGYNESNSNPPVYVCRDYKAEREITDPLSTSSGLVFFTTYKPYSDECSLGGKSFIWAVKYSSGGAPGAMLKGVALLQVSTGSIEQVDLSQAFSGAGSAGGRKSSSLEGVPPTNKGLSVMVGPPPVNRVIHMRER
jgi:Tfp pilus tip-associated adhesin PilY1